MIILTDTIKKIRLFGLVKDSIVDGVGIRTAIFTQGCPHFCKGCHNPKSHSTSNGELWEMADVIKAFSDNPLLDGITLSGGEPFMQPAACAILARKAHELNLNVWTYTGYTFENLIKLSKFDVHIKDLLAETDVLVDGPFIMEKRSLELGFCGSTNQRLIDVPQSLVENQVVLYNPPLWE